jgi:DNA-binding GntR family transcriptional regulator
MAKQLFRKIEPRSLSQQAAKMLRDAIMSGELSPGEHLNERAIARQMGISRVPVREAIQQLEHEGLVINTPNRGSFVRYFDEQDIKEIFDLRAVLEGLACQIIVQGGKLEAADFELLQGYVQDQQKAIAAGDYDGWVDAEIQFHTFICKKAESKRLLEMWQNLHVQCLFATRKDWRAYLRAYGSHPIILDALRHQDPEQFIPFHQQIYAKIRQSALDLMRATNNGPEPVPQAG